MSEPNVMQRDSRVNAAAMLLASRSDPEMAIPSHPAVIPGAAFTITDQQLIADGAAYRQVLQGRAATTLVPELIPRLDGKATVAEIAEGLGVPAVEVEASVALMASCGLIIGSPDLPVDVPEGAAKAVARHLDTTRAWRSAKDAYAALRAAPVQIVVTGSGEAAIARILEACGDCVTMINPEQAPAPGALVLVVGARPDVIRAVHERAAGVGAVVFVAGGDGRRVWMGPRLELGHALCSGCLLAGLADLGIDPDAVRELPETDSRLVAGLVAAEVFNQRIRIGRPLANNSLLVHDLQEGTTDQYFVCRRPGCERCGLPGTRREPTAAFLYDQAAVFPPRDQVSMKGHQMHYKPANIAMQWSSRVFESAEHLTLCDEDGFARPRTAAQQLGCVLRYGYGLRSLAQESRVRRFSPTGGNLGSPEAAVLVRDLPGVPAGIYYYEPFSDSLALITDQLGAAGSALTGCDDEVVIVTTAALDRISRKYAALALRICLLDAGAALSQVQRSARFLGLAAVPIRTWDDAILAEALRNDPDKHPVMSVVGIQGFDKEKK